MAKFIISMDINKSPDIVWSAFIDSHNMMQWMSNLEKVELIKGKFGEIGAIGHLHYLEKGHSYVLEEKLIDYEFEKKIKSQITGQGINIEVETNLNSIPNGTKISMTWKGTSKNSIARIIMRLMQNKITKNSKEELNRFKQLVEKYGTKFPEKSLESKNNEQ